MGYRTNAHVLALFCLLAVSTLLTTAANVVAKEEGHVAVDAKGMRKVLNEKNVESVGKATNDQDIPSLEDEKYYDHGHGGQGHGGYGHGGYGHGGYGHGGYGHGGHGGYGHGGHGGYGHGGHGCYHC